jgi:hypothetical protein
MKIEIGESLLLSWLRHIKECQLVQTNWKASSKWELKNKDILEKLMTESSELFKSKYGYDLYKGNSGLDQILAQAEIDVMGISFEDKEQHIYAIDVAFHEAGLNYGSKEETVTRVIKKCIRAAMCIYGYFSFSIGTIIFTSPKINPAVINDIDACADDIELVMRNLGLNFDVRIIANDDFSEDVLEPLLNVLGDVADTSELFMRSLQMYNLFASQKPRKSSRTPLNTEPKRISTQLEPIEYTGLEGLKEMKIGVVVRNVFRGMLENGEVAQEEIEKMQNKEYSKETFHIQFPLLLKVSETNGKAPDRYYAPRLNIFGEEYYLCSEWYERDDNNDRPYLMKWLALHK